LNFTDIILFQDQTVKGPSDFFLYCSIWTWAWH